uniref:Mitogen-activated protein kinase kinase kinase 9 n=1 Tax=Neogobius melanostomus TaxID=47308 RepID=A0A8C6UXG6_9GOBI
METRPCQVSVMRQLGDVFEPDTGPSRASGCALWTAVFDYEATAEDELSLRRGDVVEVLSKDSLVSGDEGWWTGMIADRVGIFPSNYCFKRDNCFIHSNNYKSSAV